MVGRSCLNFTFSCNDQLSPPSFSINQTTIVSHRAPNLDVISNPNWVFIESTTPKSAFIPFEIIGVLYFLCIISFDRVFL
jgi:hypothetical protein